MLFLLFSTPLTDSFLDANFASNENTVFCPKSAESLLSLAYIMGEDGQLEILRALGLNNIQEFREKRDQYQRMLECSPSEGSQIDNNTTIFVKEETPLSQIIAERTGLPVCYNPNIIGFFNVLDSGSIRSKWKDVFDVTRTEMRCFTPANTPPVEVRTMYRNADPDTVYTYKNGPIFALGLPMYGNLEFVYACNANRPDGHVTKEEWQKILDGKKLNDRSVEIYLPKHAIATDKYLNHIFKRAGIHKLFSSANFLPEQIGQIDDMLANQKVKLIWDEIGAKVIYKSLIDSLCGDKDRVAFNQPFDFRLIMYGNIDLVLGHCALPQDIENKGVLAKNLQLTVSEALAKIAEDIRTDVGLFWLSEQIENKEPIKELNIVIDPRNNINREGHICIYGNFATPENIKFVIEKFVHYLGADRVTVFHYGNKTPDEKYFECYDNSCISKEDISSWSVKFNSSLM